MDILYLVDRLENLIASSRRMPLVNQIIVKESDILTIVDQMRTSIPEEVKQARRITQERDRILAQAQTEATAIKERIAAQAQAEAENVVAQARNEAARLVDQQEIIRQAESRAEQIRHLTEERAQELIQQAEEHSDYLKSDADAYVAETLRNLREHLASIEMDVSRTILSIEKGLESLEEQQAQQIQTLADEEQEPEYQDYEDEDDDGESIPPPSSAPAPRRASLAADTMGGPNLQ